MAALLPKPDRLPAALPRVALPGRSATGLMFRDGRPARLSDTERAQLAADGHVLLPTVLRPEFCAAAIAALAEVERLGNEEAGVRRPSGWDGLTQDIPGRTVAYGDYVCEQSDFFASLVDSPTMLALAADALGPYAQKLSFSSCVALCRAGGCESHSWHTHPIDDEEDRSLRYVRIFLHLSGFGDMDGGALRVVPRCSGCRAKSRSLCCSAAGKLGTSQCPSAPGPTDCGSAAQSGRRSARATVSTPRASGPGRPAGSHLVDSTRKRSRHRRAASS
jgi:hypothetical protein